MNGRLEFATSYEEVKKNIVQFNEDLGQKTDIITQLSQFKHWYYIEEIDMFGPSKYIGYKGINASNYNRGMGWMEETRIRYYSSGSGNWKKAQEKRRKLSSSLNFYSQLWK